MTLPGAKDPDELIRATPKEWPARVRSASPVPDFVLAGLEGRYDLSSVEGKKAAADEMCDVLTRIANPIEQHHYVQQVAELLRVREQAIAKLVRQKQQRVRFQPHQVELSTDESVERDALDEHALALLLHLRRHPVVQVAWAPSEGDLMLPQSRALLKFLVDPARPAVPTALEPALRNVEGRVALIERSPARELGRAIDEVQVELEARALLARARQAQHLLREAASNGERCVLLRELGVLDVPQALQGLDERLGPLSRVGRAEEEGEALSRAVPVSTGTVE
jgi:DNA primase